MMMTVLVRVIQRAGELGVIMTVLRVLKSSINHCSDYTAVCSICTLAAYSNARVGAACRNRVCMNAVPPLAHDACPFKFLFLTTSTCRYDTGFNIAGNRFSSRIVALMAADMLLGDEQRWHGLTANGTAAFFDNVVARMIVLSRMGLDNDIEQCCNLTIYYGCHDAFAFRPQLHSGCRLKNFDFQQNIWQLQTCARSGHLILVLTCPFFTTTFLTCASTKMKTGTLQPTS